MLDNLLGSGNVMVNSPDSLTTAFHKLGPHSEKRHKWSYHYHYSRKTCHNKIRKRVGKHGVGCEIDDMLKEKNCKDLLWSLHISTTNLLSSPLNILKNTAVYSFKSFEAKASSPNGPRALLTDAPFWLQSNCGLVHPGSSFSAFLKSLTSNEISTSACNTKTTKVEFWDFSVVG